jgi:hypothetical protein
MNVIGIAGAARAGKGSIAATLVREYNFVEINFADELKRTAMRLWPLWGEEDLWGDLKEKQWPVYGGLSPRRALQFLGTEIGRGLDVDLWVRHWARAVDAVTAGGWVYTYRVGLLPWSDAPPKNVVSSDMRFPNEVAAVRARAGLAWRVIGKASDELDSARRAHASECALDGIEVDHTVWNTLGLSELADAVRRAYERR